MPVSVWLRRQGIRTAYVLLRVYWLITRPATTGVKCVLLDGDQVLLVRHTYGDPAWDFPGGSVKRREHPTTTARREMMEELGIALGELQPLGIIEFVKQRRRNTVHVYRGEVTHPRLRVDLGELDAVEWFPRDALPRHQSRYVEALLAGIGRLR